MQLPHLALITITGLAICLGGTVAADETTGSVFGTLTVAGYPVPEAKVSLHRDGGRWSSSVSSI
jgi:hypothetical protein